MELRFSDLPFYPFQSSGKPVEIVPDPFYQKKNKSTMKKGGEESPPANSGTLVLRVDFSILKTCN